jgi:hypothetical protein
MTFAREGLYPVKALTPRLASDDQWALKLALARERFAQKSLRVSAISSVITSALRGDSMGKEARVGLLLAGACCLLACMVDWIIVEL